VAKGVDWIIIAGKLVLKSIRLRLAADNLYQWCNDVVVCETIARTPATHATPLPACPIPLSVFMFIYIFILTYTNIFQLP